MLKKLQSAATETLQRGAEGSPMSQDKQKKAEADRQTSSPRGWGEGFRLTTGSPTAFRPGWLTKKDVTRIMSKLLTGPTISSKYFFVAFLEKCFLKSSKDILVPKCWVLRAPNGISDVWSLPLSYKLLLG